MSRRENARFRCARCRLHASLCVCALIPRLETRTRVLLLIHRFEDRKPTNTGRLATECLPNSAVHVRGDESARELPALEPGGPAVETQPLLLFPYADARPLADFAGTRTPLTLVVPDGNWRQAWKVRRRVPGLAGVPAVSLPPGAPSAYRLRAESQPGGLSTLEAIARALGILEGPAVEREMMLLLRRMVDRTLWARGEIAAAQVEGGVPPGARRHDPISGRSPPEEHHAR